MSLHYLLDGYNIVHQMPTSAPEKLEDQRNRLVGFIERCHPQGSPKNKVTIVFDSKVDIVGQMQSSCTNIIFSKTESADDKIKALVAQSSSKKSLVVVTDDRDVRYAVRALGAKVQSVQGFLTKKKSYLEQTQTRHKQTGRREQSKYISKNVESKITSELEAIWLKKRKN